ncbi:MAG TPA: response regulator [Candidatus Saccharimonadales bacterium]|nr:response regulator [Candidatus Saccharimonadales bacterium]
MKTGNKQRILIVEDERALNKSYKRILETAGYSVTTAYNGKEALAAVANEEPELILLDMEMPVMDGLAFLKAYNLAEHEAVKVMVFSDSDNRKQIDAAYRLGAAHFVLKTWLSAAALLVIASNMLLYG